MGQCCLIEWILGCTSGTPSPPADFAGANDVITNLAKEREPDDIGCTP